jgi:hypothetical protein
MIVLNVLAPTVIVGHRMLAKPIRFGLSGSGHWLRERHNA